MLTPYFAARCNSLLAYLFLKGKVFDWSIEDVDVVHILVADGKVRYTAVGNYLMAVPGAQPYQHGNWPQRLNVNDSGRPNPLVLELAGENPDNEEFVRVYRKNVDYCLVG